MPTLELIILPRLWRLDNTSAAPSRCAADSSWWALASSSTKAVERDKRKLGRTRRRMPWERQAQLNYSQRLRIGTGAGMLHEILLSLSGHPSPLLQQAVAGPVAHDDGHHDSGTDPSLSKLLSPSECALLASIAHLSDLHAKLRAATAATSASHPSAICRAVAAAVEAAHLAAFQRRVLDVEEAVLRRDAGLVGAYGIVPLTAVAAELAPWSRRLEWLWELARFMAAGEGTGGCTGAAIIDRLRGELQTGYADVEETARSLIGVAERAWLKQVSAWILYGRLPSFGADDFFVQQRLDGGEEDCVCVSSLLPSFVTPSTASSMLFIGRSLNHIRTIGVGGAPGLHKTDHLSSQLKALSALTYPLDSATFSRTVTGVRQFLSRTTLQKLLPLSKVLEALQLLREFFLLGRGEFATALAQQADEMIRNRWRRVDSLAYERREGLGTVAVKEGEVAAVLERTWAAMGSMQGQHADEDEGLELARDLVRLTLGTRDSASREEKHVKFISATPFRDLLFSVPVVMTLRVQSPLDLFLSQSDLQTYTLISSYLLSIRRGHIRLTDLWKTTSLRRHHPSPPQAGREKVRELRERHTSRANALRSVWATASAAVFFLAETEAYLQTEVVGGLWDGFQQWLTTGHDAQRHDDSTSAQRKAPSLAIAKAGPEPIPEKGKDENVDKGDEGDEGDEGDDDDGDVWLAAAVNNNATSPSSANQSNANDKNNSTSLSSAVPLHDPQTLSAAHRLYLGALIDRLLLTQRARAFTDALHDLLTHTDALVALARRLHDVWAAADLEADVGVVDAFVDLAREERELRRELTIAAERVRRCVRGAVAEMRRLGEDSRHDVLLGGGGGDDSPGAEGGEDNSAEYGGFVGGEHGMYVPRRVGGVDHLLMKLDFGSWFGPEEEDDALDRI